MWPTALWFVSGRDDRRVADRVERLLQGEEAARLDAVVVGHEDPRPGRPVAERPGHRLQRPRSAARSAAGDRLAPFLVDVPALDPGPLPVHVGIPRPVGHVVTSTSTSTSSPGMGSRGTRIGRPSRISTRLAARCGDTAGVAGPAEVVEEERRHDRGDRDAEDRPDDPADLRADEHRAEDDDRMDARPPAA